MIEAHNLKKTYPDGTVALAGLDLAFGDGMLGLLGPNGAGKTTLLSILALAQEPSAGERVYFGVRDGSGQRSRIRRTHYRLTRLGERILSAEGGRIKEVLSVIESKGIQPDERLA